MNLPRFISGGAFSVLGLVSLIWLTAPAVAGTLYSMSFISGTNTDGQFESRDEFSGIVRYLGWV